MSRPTGAEGGRRGEDLDVVDGDVAFRSPAGDAVTLDLRQVSVVADENVYPAAVLMEVVADPEAWARIDGGALFHLDPGARGPVLGGGFAAKPVRITAVLDRHAMAALGEVDAGDVAARMREVTGGEDPLVLTESWWALDATALIEPPPGMPGELHGGMRTIWRSDPPPAGLATILAAAIGTEDVEPSVEATDDGNWIVRFTEPEAIGLALPREPAGQAIVYVILPRICPREHRAELARLAALVNYDLPIGCLEVSLELGQARVRTSTDVTGDRLSLAVAENLVGAARHLAAAWFPAVLAVMDGASAEGATGER